ncbi:hypothetical protein AYO48_04580 [Gaiella sp. SCGC AG-212-M14]|nr:hypothetical protein AYO48_04580 [Gaiella sp. SCGC AG-212-M14]
MAQVWPWIVQLEEGRSGFYSYDFLENLVGSDIHSSDRVVREWQGVGSATRSGSRASRDQGTS